MPELSETSGLLPSGACDLLSDHLKHSGFPSKLPGIEAELEGECDWDHRRAQKARKKSSLWREEKETSGKASFRWGRPRWGLRQKPSTT